MEHPALQITDPGICVVRLGLGERPSRELRSLLNPVDPGSFHQYRLPAGTDVELHYHDYDEHWLFASGRPRVTLRAPSGATREFDLEPGDLVACVRGVEHTLWADHELVYYQYSSVLTGGERPGHLRR
jgi:mannose-6-phosphate isomerase-like protein (cupin superfamily)